jgi:threonine/homoserine/homoserine lactone efflux protein
MVTGQQLLSFLPPAMLVAASPGAGNFLALNNGLRSGPRRAIIALAGRLSAFAALIVLVMVGAGALLAASAVAFSVLKWLGVAYLVWLGVRLWRSDTAPVTGDNAAHDASALRLAAREFTVALTNPKAILLFTAFLPQFVARGRPMPSQFLTLGAVYILLEFLAASGYAIAGSRITMLRLSRQGVRRVNRISAGIMLLAAGWLATMKRTA